jgi:hypothetical protein
LDHALTVTSVTGVESDSTPAGTPAGILDTSRRTRHQQEHQQESSTPTGILDASGRRAGMTEREGNRQAEIDRQFRTASDRSAGRGKLSSSLADSFLADNSLTDRS